MIGLFDSGFGGLQTLTYFRKIWPDYDYIFLADQKNYPYGSKTKSEIKRYTFAGLQRLFDQGASIVIVACNTAAAFAIRERQKQYPEKKALSITIPGMEKVVDQATEYKHISILATQGTLSSGIYYSVYHALGGRKDTSLDIIVAPDLVDLVEKGVTDRAFRLKTLIPYIQQIEKVETDCLILGCTHFPVLTDEIKSLYKGDIIDPAREAAQQFDPYLARHPEIAIKLSKNNKIAIYTTGNKEDFEHIGSSIMALDDIPVKKVILSTEKVTYTSISKKLGKFFGTKRKKQANTDTENIANLD